MFMFVLAVCAVLQHTIMDFLSIFPLKSVLYIFSMDLSFLITNLFLSFDEGEPKRYYKMK